MYKSDIFPVNLSIIKSFTDPDEMTEFTYFWDLESNILNNAEFNGYLSVAHTPNIQLSICQYLNPMSIKGSIPDGTLLFAFSMTKISAVHRLSAVNENKIYILNSSEEADLLSSSNSKIFTLCINEATFLSSYRDNFNEEYKHTHTVRPYKVISKEFKSKLVHILNILILQNGTLTDNDYKNIENEIIYTLLNCIVFEHTKSIILKSNLTAYHLYLSLSEAINQDTTVSILCKNLNISERTAYYNFRNLYGITPNQYIKHTRLSRIHRELKNSNRNYIKDIASKYGYNHMGHFSKEYKAKYGLKPSKVNNI